MNDERPKCLDLEDAVQEVKWWCGVNIARFDYSAETLGDLFAACVQFQKKARGDDE